MGVSGSGKSTVGNLLSEKIKVPFIDADDFHPKANIEKMSKGVPLDDEDRKPWLEALNKKMNEAQDENGIILACSALKESYREILSKRITWIEWVYLEGSFTLIKSRMEKRKHFMKADLLQSQFDCLEVPNYATTIANEEEPEVLVNTIINKMKTSSFGILGLGVMGKSLATNMLNKGFSISVYNRETPEEKGIVDAFIDENFGRRVLGFTELKEFITSIQKPRKILMMIKAGKVTDTIIESMVPFLEEGDVLIDGGNSHYLDTKRRSDYLEDNGIEFVGLGVSGGEEGALKGPSLMPGGKKGSYAKVAKYLEAISAKDEENNPCCSYIGPDGAGHFVKMVHNGIEYGDMQLLAEVYAILSETMNNEEIASLLSEWNTRKHGSYLLEITSKITKEKESDTYMLDIILDKAGNKGTGSWSSIAALEMGVPTTVKNAAVHARYTSSFKDERVRLSKYKNQAEHKEVVNVEVLEQAYDFARTVNLHQGFQLLKAASDEFNWNLNLAEICRVWSNGCIIKSKKIKEYSRLLKEVASLFEDEGVILNLYSQEAAARELITYTLQHRIHIPCFYEAYNYWVAMTTARSLANVIQAQRDFFGAHRFQKVGDKEEKTFHYNWS